MNRNCARGHDLNCRVGSFLLSILMILLLLPVSAYAASAEGASVTIAGAKLTKDTPYYVNGKGAVSADGLTDGVYHAHYDADTRTLTLNGLSIEKYNGNGIETSGMLTLVLEGDNSITLWSHWNNTKNDNKGISAGTLVIRGTGSLTLDRASGESYAGICMRTAISASKFYMQSGNVTVKDCYSSAISSNDFQMTGGVLSTASGGHSIQSISILFAGGTYTGFAPGSYSAGDSTYPYYVFSSNPTLSSCCNYTIMAGTASSDAQQVEQGTSYRYKYMKISADSGSHTSAVDAARAATCTATGLTEGRHCSVCSAILEPQTETPTISHSMTHVSSNAASCTASGNVEYWHCDTCGKDFADEGGKTVLETVRINANGHSMTHVSSKAASCKTSGNVEYWHCGTCGKDFSDEAGNTELLTVTLPVTDHNYVHQDLLPASHTSAGMEEHYTCSTCDAYFDASKVQTTKAALEIPQISHSFGDWVQTADEHKKVCSCGAVSEQGAHQFETILDTPATEEREGTKHEECKVCHYAKPAETVEKLPHTHVMEVHSAVAPSCTTDGTKAYWHCKKCGKDFADATGSLLLPSVTDPAPGHTMTYNEGKPATETEKGIKAHWYCSVCRKYFADREGQTELKSIEIEATGRGQTSNPDSFIVPDAYPEKEEKTVTETENVTTAGGSEKLSAESGTGDTELSPETGDGSALALFALLAVLSAGCAILLSRKRAKRS